MSEPLEHDYIGLSADSSSMEKSSNFSTETENNNALNLKATELRLGLPGFTKDIDEIRNKTVSTKNFFPGNKRGFSDVDVDDCRNWGFNGECDTDSNKVSSSSALFSPKNVNNTDLNQIEEKKNRNAPPVSKAQVVGWPPIRSFRKNTMVSNLPKNDAVAENLATGGGCLYVKVSMDGAPYLRKVDLKSYCNYADLSKALHRLFTCFTLGSEYVVTYEDKDGDWMLVGDVPWEMFIDSCKRLRIMKGSEATGLAPRPLSIART